MPRRVKPAHVEPHQQLALDFDAVIGQAEVLSREEVVAKAQSEGRQGRAASAQTDGGEGDEGQDQDGYDPTGQTSSYMRRAVQFEEAWETTIRHARKELLKIDPRELYLGFFQSLAQQIQDGSPRAAKFADLLEAVAIRGFGMTRQQIPIERPRRGGANRWRVPIDANAVRSHLEAHIVGKYFLDPVVVDGAAWGGRTPVVGASDVSQHRSAVPVPARFFKRSVPFVLNNAAGTMFGVQGGSGKPKYDNLFNPKPDDALLRWMLIDPSYQDELDPEDYQRCLASAMDVGQYKFDLEYLLKADLRPPDVVFRDGSLFPQDAYIDNFIVESKRGDFTREAIRELLSCLSYAREVGTLYCGVSKQVQLKVYSSVVDWFVATYIDKNWEVGGYTLNDGQAMTLLLSSPEFVADNLAGAAATCLIRRSFTTRANLNTRGNLADPDTYFRFYQDQHPEVDITPFRRLCELAHVYMFFVGHSKSPQQQLPRYEFFHTGTGADPGLMASKILAALQYCGLSNDYDHSHMAAQPVTYLLPTVTQQAHLLCKDVGKYIDTATGQWIMARYQSMLPRE